MPCNSDYMNPSPQEISRLRAADGHLKAVADKMVFAADVVRDAIIDAQGNLDNLTPRDAVAVGKYLATGEPLVVEGNKVLSKMQSEYAYASKPGVEVAYLRARDEYLDVLGMAQYMSEHGSLDAARRQKVEEQRAEHHKGDVQRLIKIFADKNDFATVAKLASVDFSQPLEPQIGFSPDDY